MVYIERLISVAVDAAHCIKTWQAVCCYYQRSILSFVSFGSLTANQTLFFTLTGVRAGVERSEMHGNVWKFISKCVEMWRFASSRFKFQNFVNGI